jgi:hypothetical protein
VEFVKAMLSLATARTDPTDLKRLGCKKIMVEYFLNRYGDFYSVPVQVIGLPNVGCPSACLKQNCSHSLKEGRSNEKI